MNNEIYVKNEIIFRSKWDNISDSSSDLLFDIAGNKDVCKVPFTIKTLCCITGLSHDVVKACADELVNTGLFVRVNRIKYDLNKDIISLEPYEDTGYTIKIPSVLRVTDKFYVQITGIEEEIISVFVLLAMQTKCCDFKFNDNSSKVFADIFGCDELLVLKTINTLLEVGILVNKGNNILSICKDSCTYQG